jgi:hypothetical protein
MTFLKFAAVSLALMGLTACVIREEPVRVHERGVIVVP